MTAKELVLDLAPIVDDEGRTSCCNAFTTYVEGYECCKVCYEEVDRSI